MMKDEPERRQKRREAAQPGLRARLFEPGKYISIPRTILSRADLSASAKLVWMELASHLGDAGAATWPSTGRLCRRTGLGRNTVLRATEALADAGLIDVDTRDGPRGTNVYRIRQPEVVSIAEAASEETTETAPDQSQNGTSAKMALVPERDRGRSQNGTDPGPKMGHEVLKKYSSTHTNAPARAAGVVGEAAEVVCVCSDAGTEKQPTATASGPNTQSPVPNNAFSGEAEAIEHVRAAYRQACNAGIPTSWKAKIVEAHRDGLTAEIAAINAEAIIAAKSATPKDRTFGFGWLMIWLQKHPAGKRTALSDFERRQLAEREAMRRRANEEQRRQRAADAERLAAFRDLPDVDRERWLAETRAKFPHFRTAERLEKEAAILAMGEREVMA